VGESDLDDPLPFTRVKPQPLQTFVEVDADGVTGLCRFSADRRSSGGEWYRMIQKMAQLKRPKKSAVVTLREEDVAGRNDLWMSTDDYQAAFDQQLKEALAIVQRFCSAIDASR
jgi:hypothetical protein